MASRALTLADLGADLRAAGAALRDPRPLLKRLKVLCVSTLQRDMTAGRSPDGVPYRPLLFARPRGGTKPLLDTGLLRASLAAGPGHVERDTAAGFVIGTNRPGAALMQAGGTVLPTRGKFLAIPKTREAQRAGSPRRFPRPLVGLFGPRGGVLVDRRDRSTVQYVLTKRAVVPARPFIGFAKDFLAAARQMAVDFFFPKGR